MIDFHSHILPKMDDGSESSEMSVKMLHLSQKQGVKTIALTPHFYAFENSPQRFLERREASWQRLQTKLDDHMPQIRLGAEVQYFEGIAMADDLEGLRLSGTDVLLLEMPFSKWSERMIGDVLELNGRYDMQIMLAHIERYMAWQRKDIWEYFHKHHVLLQCNADFFLYWRTAGKARKIAKDRLIDALGSDAHNLTSRKSHMGEADESIRAKCDQAVWKHIEQSGRRILEGSSIYEEI